MLFPDEAVLPQVVQILKEEVEALMAPSLGAMASVTSALGAVKDSEVAAIQKIKSPSPTLKLVLEVKILLERALVQQTFQPSEDAWPHGAVVATSMHC